MNGLDADSRFVGVDGCPAGWVAAGTDPDGEWGVGVFPAFAALLDHLDRPERVLVDVPVGLNDDAVRACDEMASDLLGCRGASVFRTPVRRAVELRSEESDGRDLRPEASEHNEAATGHGISVQAWNIADAILEVDAAVDRLDGVVREAHPELAFAAFNGQPVAYSKTSERGRSLRLELLESENEAAPAAAERATGKFPASDVGDDDVLDAMALALAARDDLQMVPEDPNAGQPRIYFPDRPFAGQSYFSG